MCVQSELLMTSGPMSEIVRMLDLNRWNDLRAVNDVLFAKHRNDLSPPRSEVRVSRPLTKLEATDALETALPSYKDSVQRLLSLFNGLRVENTNFVVYSYLTEKLPGNSVRLDIVVPNVYERPSFISNDDLIVGTSNAKKRKEQSAKVFHVFSASGEIYLKRADEPEKIFRSYASVDKWIVTEFERALSGNNLTHQQA